MNTPSRDTERHVNQLFTKLQKSIAKKKHKASERSNPKLFREAQLNMATDIVTSASKKAPKWGGFVFKHGGMTYNFKK